MPLVRKPADHSSAQKPDADDVLQSLGSPDPDLRWAAARGAADVPGGGAALAAALPAEDDLRVREAMFTSLSRIGTPETVGALLTLLRSDDASLRTGALDTLRIMAVQVHDLLPKLLGDHDADVRILSCELARSLPNEEATGLMCGLLSAEREVNVCAAAVDVLAEVGSADALPALQECARRFRDSRFLSFAIEIVIDRLTARSTQTRG
jgi:HEAT repeat protein